jgi:hypothetical protein
MNSKITQTNRGTKEKQIGIWFGGVVFLVQIIELALVVFSPQQSMIW